MGLIMKEKIAITGAKGTIGKVLMAGLTDYDLKPMDLPEVDVRNQEKLIDEIKGRHVVIHLAWDTETENWRSGKINPENMVMTFNVYEAAKRTGAKRVIMASSVHADQFRTWESQNLLTVDRVPVPTSPYGASKVFMETLGRFFATQGLEIICIRFGGSIQKTGRMRLILKKERFGLHIRTVSSFSKSASKQRVSLIIS